MSTTPQKSIEAEVNCEALQESAAPSKETKDTVVSPLVKADKPYYAGIDIIKILAVFFVICIHFFLYSGFYYTPITETKYYAPIAFRWITYTCVPLFMIATGYLMKNKKFSGKYYLGLIKIIVMYLLISVLCIHFREMQFHEEFDTWKTLRGFLEYNNANYGWYINYYICIFMLIPFLNLAFNGLENKWQRLVLVITITLITIFARSLFLGFEKGNQIKLFPDYLNGAWPLAYYFAGAYIREHPPVKKVLSKIITAIVLVGTVIFITLSSYNHSINDVDNEQRFTSLHFNDYGTYPVFIIAVCIFLLLFDIKTTNSKVKFVLRNISDTTLVLYMISYIFDQKNYYDANCEYTTIHQKIFSFLHGGSTNALNFNLKYEDVFERWEHCYEVILLNFFSSLVWALIINGIYRLCENLIRKGISKRREKKQAVPAAE